MNNSNSVHAFNEAKMVIPGGVDSPVRAFKSVGGTPPFIQRGEGAYMYDIDGNQYIDFVQSWGPLIFGHADKDIEEAVIDKVKQGLSFGAPTMIETVLAKMVLKSYEGVDKLRFVNSGTEAVMSAIRLARGFTGREDIIKFEGCYHGHSDSLLVKAGSGATTFGTPSSPGVPQDLTKHTLLAKYNDIESVKKCFEGSPGVACVIIEPIAGNMGLVKAEKAFLQELRTLCDQHDTILIFDEVMSGFRAAFGGAQEVFDITPDMVTFGKVIGGGMPVGAFGGHVEVMNHLSPDGPVYQAGTLSGNPVAMAAGLAMMEKLEKNRDLYAASEAKARKLTDAFKEMAAKNGITLQSDVVGTMFGFFFNDKPVKNFDDALTSDTEMFAAFHQKMLEQGVYFACSQFEAAFMSSVITDEIVDEVIKKAEIVFMELRALNG